MSSILKVDTIQTTAGAAPRPKDIGLTSTGMPVQTTQALSGSRVTGSGSNTWHELNCTHSITPVYNDSKFICHFHQNVRMYIASNSICRAGFRLKRKIGSGGSWTVLTNTAGHRETFQVRLPSSVTQELGDVYSGDYLDAPSHNGSDVYYMLEGNIVSDSGSGHAILSWEGSRGNWMNITEIVG
tara:strand:+ start:547 stop:1098 length:552 start_codon:yes stop_codon:yes gene_type:complete